MISEKGTLCLPRFDRTSVAVWGGAPRVTAGRAAAPAAKPPGQAPRHVPGIIGEKRCQPEQRRRWSGPTQSARSKRFPRQWPLEHASVLLHHTSIESHAGRNRTSLHWPCAPD